MPNVLFIILISFFTLCISFVSVKGTLTNLKFTKKWWKIITKRGWITIILTITIIMLLVWQNYLSEKTNDKKDEALRKEKEKSDSIVTNRIKAGVDSNRQILFDDLSKALAKQGLEFDSASNRLEKIVRDSSKTRVIEKDDPVLEVVERNNKKVFFITALPNNRLRVSIHFTSSDAGSSGFNIKLSAVLKDSNGVFSYMGFNNPFENTNQISKNTTSENAFIITTHKKSTQLYYFWVRGKYKSIDKSKEFYLENVYYLDPKTVEYGMASVDDREEIKSIVLKNEK